MRRYVFVMICFISINGYAHANGDFQAKGNDMKEKHMMEALSNIPTAADAAEANVVREELVKRSVSSNITNTEPVVYVSPKRKSITFNFYNITDIELQDKLCEILKRIKLERKLKKLISIKFIKKENVVNHGHYSQRENEKIVRTITLD